MSDGVNFTAFPLWEDMDFTKDCSLYGNWLYSFLKENVWNPAESFDGSALVTIYYFKSALPESYSFPWDGPLGADDGMILDWYGWNV